MRQSSMSLHTPIDAVVVDVTVEDMTLHADLEPWNFGACRRR